MKIFKIISLVILLGAVLVAGERFIQKKSDKGYTKERAKEGERVSRGIGIGVMLGTVIGLLVNHENMYYFSALGMGIGMIIGMLRGKIIKKN